MEPAASKALRRRLVDEVINPWDLDALDALCTPRLARRLRSWFSEFHAAFPDWRQEIVQLIAEGDVVVARFRCHGTHTGAWLGLDATGRAMRVDEVYVFTLHDGLLDEVWGLEDTWSRLRQLLGEDEAARGRLRGPHFLTFDPGRSLTVAGMKQGAKRVAGPLGLGAAACVVCCAGPLLGLIGGLSLAGSAVALTAGTTVVAMLLVVVAVAVLVIRRRRRQQASACATGIPPAEPIAAPVLPNRTPAS